MSFSRKLLGPAPTQVVRIDTNHSNPKATWQAMGAPRKLSPGQLEQLKAASAAVTEPLPCAVGAATASASWHAGSADDWPAQTRVVSATVTLVLPPQAVALLYITLQ